MDPSFVERHWESLPNLRALRDHGYFSRLTTTTPPQSPVAWSTFITGLNPDQHGLYDFVHRDPATLRPFSSMTRTDEPKWVLPLGPYLFPLSKPHIATLRHGTPFWKLLSDRGIPVIVQRMPTNYPPIASGIGLSGMGTPDLLGSQGTFNFFTDDPAELPRSVAGGQIQKVHLSNGRAVLQLPGPPNPLRKDHALTQTIITLDVDAKSRAARLKTGEQAIILQQGEWSDWLSLEFTLLPHISSIRGMVRVFAKQLQPRLEIYVSPINIDPSSPALPISTPSGYAAETESQIGPYFTLGIPQDTAALRQSVFNLPDFQRQAQFILADELKLLYKSLADCRGGFLFFYFSSVDQNSHMLWAKHEEQLLEVYQAIDQAVEIVRKQAPAAELMILSDHGFTTFTRAVHLNAWLRQGGFLSVHGSAGSEASFDTVDWSSTEAYAIGLNGLYLNRKGRERHGIVAEGQQSQALLANLQAQLLAWRDPAGGHLVVEAATPTNPTSANAAVAPDLIVGYAPGYRASWQTGVGGTPDSLMEDNEDAWIGDHCINAVDVPGVLFGSRRLELSHPKLQDMAAFILQRFGVASSP